MIQNCRGQSITPGFRDPLYLWKMIPDYSFLFSFDKGRFRLLFSFCVYGYHRCLFPSSSSHLWKLSLVPETKLIKSISNFFPLVSTSISSLIKSFFSHHQLAQCQKINKKGNESPKYLCTESFERVSTFSEFSPGSLSASRISISHCSSGQLNNLAGFLCCWVQQVVWNITKVSRNGLLAKHLVMFQQVCSNKSITS